MRGDDFAFVASVDTKISFIDRDDGMVGVEFAHANETEVGDVGLSVAATLGQRREMGEVALTVKRQADQPFVRHLKYKRRIAQMQRAFGKDGFACEKRFRHMLCNA